MRVIFLYSECESHSVVSYSWICVTPRTIQSLDFPKPEYWSGKSFPSPGDLPNRGVKPRSPALQEGSLPFEPSGKPKNTGVGSLSLLQEIFPGIQPGSPAVKVDSLPAELLGKPYILVC